MSAHGMRLAAILVGAVALALLLPASTALVPATTAAPTVVGPVAAAPISPSVAPTLSGSGSAVATSSIGSSVLANLKAAHAPMGEVFLPNFNARTSVANGVVSPLYTTAPAPMGLGDFGIEDVHGHNVGTISYTDSVKASVGFNSLDPLYLGAAGPDQFTIQANTVLTHVDVWGNDSNQFWIQNVPVYYASEDLLVFEDNIWNFSSPSFYFPPSSIYAHGPLGFFAGDEVYIGIGEQAFNIAPPFTITTYNNVSTVGGLPTVFFNFTLSQDGQSVSGSYDFAQFNAFGGAPTGIAPPATYQINGEFANPTGFLLNDAEIMIGGPGGGSTTNFLQISGSVGLWTQPNGTSQFDTVPSAYDFGTDTGETSAGIAEYSTGGANPTAVLGSGPSLLYPLWGVAGAVQPGAATYSFAVHPSNAFVFAAPGAQFNESAAAWAPVPASGDATYELPPGTYSFEFLLSDYAPAWVVEGAQGTAAHGRSSVAVSLAFDSWLGVYTPLWALDNAQLAGISSSGRGTIRDPYVLFNNERGAISPLFGEFNDYEFPVFPGIFLVGTTAYVSVLNAPTFEVPYSIQPEASEVAELGLPSVNFLEQNYYAVAHVSIVGASDLTGWIFADDEGFTLASVVFWNSSDNLIAGNTFGVMSEGLILFGGTNNVIWGNSFVPVTLSDAYSNSIGYNGTTFGLELWESGDLIYNNAFLTPITAVTPTVNIYNGDTEISADTWNVSYQSARDVRVVNGWGLSGNILGLAYEGGNYWVNYGTTSDPLGVLPYNNGGNITIGGDYLPLVPAPHHSHR
ncbi:MAG TPA: thermopsin family protease [Thermoplasmata archaeon]|nr:thermopsin family protease [Thermoplasmata archaeon]